MREEIKKLKWKRVNKNKPTMQSITQTQITNMQMNLNLNATMTKALVGMVKEYVTEVTTELSKIYGFPLDDALKRLDLDHLQPNEKNT